MSDGDSDTRSAVMTGTGIAVVALASAAQLALYLRSFGATHRTDGLIAAFAVYTLAVVFAQLLRTTAIPLVSGARPALSGTAFGWSIALSGLSVAVVFAAIADPLAHAVAGSSGEEGVRVARTSLQVMAPAMGLQVIGAGLAVRGAIRERLVTVAMAYMVSAVAGLVAFFILRHPAAEVVLAWTMLTASCVLVVALAFSIGAPVRRPPGWRAILRSTLLLVRSTPLPGALVVVYPITLALAPAGGGGQITIFGLAVTACSYLAGFTGQALSMVDVVAFTRIETGAVEARRALITRAFRYSMLVAIPGMGIAAVAGGPLVRGLLPHSSTGAHTAFGVDVVLLAPWLVATLAVWATLPALLADPDLLAGRRLALAVAGLLAVHVIVTLIGRAVAGFDGLIVAMAAAPATLVLVGLPMTAPGAGRLLLRHAVIVVALGAVSFGAAALAADAISSGDAAAGVVAALAGALVYVSLAAFVYPDAVRTVLRLTGRR